MKLKVKNNSISLKGIDIEFDTSHALNSFLFDYINTHGKLVDEVQLSREEEKIKHVMDNYGDILIQELDLSVRSFNCLMRAEIDTIGKVISLTVEDIFRIRNMGRRSVEEIRDRVNDFVMADVITWEFEQPDDIIEVI